ncbi:hypothetical protein AA0243_0684 [Novacetimonas hansenii NRIC 0243]|nr:hypothetical protein AA0243_0684 [Novacetimonas hansenii NRIC 0243]
MVGHNGRPFLTCRQSLCLGDIANLPSCNNEAQRVARHIGQHVDFGCQTTSGTPQRLILAPPFPFAAC